MQNEVEAPCKLCNKTAQLRYSHILPEFLYLSLYDEKHRAMRVTSDSEEKDEFIQKGIRDYLLCSECETQLSRYERYAAPIIKSIPTISADPSGNFFVISPVDYSPFKLFQMSLLWRSSIAQTPEFSDVSLGENDEIMRKMLYEENPGQSDDYGCMMIAIQNTKYLERIIWSPVRDVVDGYVCYRFQTGGIFWYFFPFNGSYPPSIKELFLSQIGVLRIVVAPWSEQQITGRIAGLIAEKMRSQRKQSA